MSKVQKIPLADVIVGERARKDYGDLTDLMESMRELKLLQPIVLAPGNRLLAGGRRLEAAKRLGWHAIPFYRAEVRDDAVAHLMAERDENTCRKPMTMSELVELGRRLEELEAPAAEQRHREGSSRGGARLGPVGPSLGGDGSIRTDQVVAEAIGSSTSQYKRMKRIARAAEDETSQEPDLVEKARVAVEEIDAGEKTVTGAYRELFSAEKGAGGRQVAPGITADELEDLQVPAKPKTRNRYNGTEILLNTSLSLEGLRTGLELVTAGNTDLQAAQESIDSIKETITIIRRKLKEITK